MLDQKRQSLLYVVYISLSGNTKSFAKRFREHLLSQYDLQTEEINVKDLNHDTFPITEPFVAILPTYLEGGNGIDTGDVEILTNPLGDFIAAHGNDKHCIGIIGSGNRNFNEQYCLTAKQYTKCFGFPMLGDFELRGTGADVERLAKITMKRLAQVSQAH